MSCLEEDPELDREGEADDEMEELGEEESPAIEALGRALSRAVVIKGKQTCRVSVITAPEAVEAATAVLNYRNKSIEGL